MKNRAPIIAIIGITAAFFAVILNLATGADAHAAQTLTLQAAIAAIIALTCGAITFRRGGGWRFLGIAMIGPSVFVLADTGMRMALLLKAGL